MKKETKYDENSDNNLNYSERFEHKRVILVQNAEKNCH